MWDLPGPGLEPVSPALAGGFLTTVPPGKPYFALKMAPKHNVKVLSRAYLSTGMLYYALTEKIVY